MNRKFVSAVVLSLAIGFAAGAIIVRGGLPSREIGPKTRTRPTPPEKTVLYWRNPMNPSIHSDHPMKDNMGMDYIPVYSGPSASAKNAVSVDPRIRQTLGIRVVPVVRRTFSRTIRTAATVVFDRHRSRTVSTRFRGWIRDLSVRAPGDAIRKGSLLARVYSPELASTEREDLIALEAVRSDLGSKDDRNLLDAARERLRLLGVPDSEISRLEKTGKARSTVPVLSSYSGIVSSISVRVGSGIVPGRPLMTLIDPSRVWVDVALYPTQLAWVKAGDRVILRVPAMAERTYRGTLQFVDPEINAKSRTVRARVSVKNPDGFLKSGMYLEATLHPDPRSRALVIPRAALIRTGSRTVVITEVGKGYFRPVRVKAGIRSEHWVEILSGLHEGDRVVVSGQFLLDAESRFENVSERMEKGVRP